MENVADTGLKGLIVLMKRIWKIMLISFVIVCNNCLILIICCFAGPCLLKH